MKLVYSPLSKYDNWSDRGGITGDWVCADLEMLDGDSLLMVDTKTPSRGIRLVPGTTGNLVHVTGQMISDSSSYYYNYTAKPVYTGGLAYDGSKYVYIGTKVFTGLYSSSNKVMRYNVYKGVGEDLWLEEINAPAWFEQIFTY